MIPPWLAVSRWVGEWAELITPPQITKYLGNLNGDLIGFLKLEGIEAAVAEVKGRTCEGDGR